MRKPAHPVLSAFSSPASVSFSHLNRPGLPASCLVRAFRLLAEPGLRRFVWIPLMVNLALYATALAAGIHYFSAFMHWLLPSWLDFLDWLLWPLFGLAFVLIMYFTFTLLANLIGAPFYGVLAERTLAHVQRAAGLSVEPPAEGGLMAEVLGELRRLGYMASRAIPLLILFLIPGLNLIAPFLWLAFNAWFLGMDYTAYPFEALGVGFDEQRRMARNMRLGLFSFGGLVMLGLAVPGLNIFMPPAAVIGATLYLWEGKVGDGPFAGSARK